MAASLHISCWTLGAALLAASAACVPDVNVTGIRGEGGGGAGTTGGAGSNVGAGGMGTGGTGTGGTGGGGLATTIATSSTAKHLGGSRCIQVVCPPGTQAIGGGGHWDASGDPPKITLTASRRAADDTWEICGDAVEADMHDWYVEAVCAAFDVEVAESPLSLHPIGSECRGVSCSAGRQILSGGGIFETRLYESNATTDDGWRLCGYSDAPDVDDWQTQALCAAVESERVFRAEMHPGGGHACITQLCPAGKKVTGGGAQFSDGEKIRLDTNRPSADNAWSVCGYADELDTHEWIIQAVCL